MLTCGALLCFDRARGASTAPAYLLCALRCFAYFDSPRGAYVLMPGLTSLRQPPGCLRAYALLCFALLRHPPGVLCFAWPGLTWPYLCFDTPRFALLRHPPGVLCSALPRGCFAWPYFLRVLLAYLRAYVFSTHTEGGDPGSLHEKKIKTKEF